MDLANDSGRGAGVTAQAGCAPTAFLGLSHLGIVSSIGWAALGQPVLAVDPDHNTVAALSAGRPPISEPGLPELLAQTRQRITFTTDLSQLATCPLVIVARDVPTDESNASDYGPIYDLIDRAVPHLMPGVVLVVMSQVTPGFTRALGERIRAARPELEIELYYWVETLIIGDAVRRCLHPERQIVGAAHPAAPLASCFDEGLRRFTCPILVMRYESAELTKTAINLYLIGSVTYANTLSDLCERIGADWTEVIPALRLDKRIGPAAYIRPGLGIAGGNLERDLVTLQAIAQREAVDSAYLDALADHNARRGAWVERKMAEHVLRPGSDRLPLVGIWGLAYKKNTRSTRNSPALRAIAQLSGRAQLRAWDPAFGPADLDLSSSGTQVVTQRDDVLPGADALLVLTDWDQFGAADLDAVRSQMRRPLIVDCVGVLEGRRSEMDGIQYVAMGH